ncbi:MAG: hypothetical protein ACREJ2_11085 [Planctomycetota bacterium]
MSDLLDGVSQAHPRLLGSRDALQALARERPREYARVQRVAREMKSGASHDDHTMRGRLMAMNLVYAIENDAALGRQAVEIVRATFLDRPVRVGHVGFGTDCGIMGMNHDLCHDLWSESDRKRFHVYLREAREKNLTEEPSVFHNGWYGMKNGPFVVACLATAHENPYAHELFAEIDHEYRTRAVPALELAGEGGGFGEGYYTHYWIFEWIQALHCLQAAAGIDWFDLAPKFHRERAVASLFELYPTLREGGSRRPAAAGDSGGRQIHPERDKTVAAMRILATRYRDDPAHQAVLAHLDRTPETSFEFASYYDFLWNDRTLPRADLRQFKLSHYSPGPGNVQSRSSWDEDASYLYFRCGRRFTTHQHLDQGHFVLFKHEELLGDGGEYCGWGESHVINYYIRTIAHNSMLVYDPEEEFPDGIRGGGKALNDGGQAVRWIGTPWMKGGDGFDVPQWSAFSEIGQTGAIIAYEDTGAYLHCSGDVTRAYASSKLAYFTRQIVHLRPDVFVVFDRVGAARPEFKKTLLLHTMAAPRRHDRHWVVGNGYGKLFVQTLLPIDPVVHVFHEDEQYVVEGERIPPLHRQGCAPRARMEVSPSQPAADDLFLHVFTLGDYNFNSVPAAEVERVGATVRVRLSGATIEFERGQVVCRVTFD